MTAPVNEIILGHALEVMAALPEQSVHLLLTDPPYNITNNEWDQAIDWDVFWKEARRICAGPVVMTASLPFHIILGASNLKELRHEWIWRKNRGSNFANTVREPMKEHEHVMVFSQKTNWTYHPQMEKRRGTGDHMVGRTAVWESKSSNYRKIGDEFEPRQALIKEERVPSSVQEFDIEYGLHPTQKPVSLGRYLVKTYSNAGDLVLDTFTGSGTFCLAAQLEGRKFIGIERDPAHHATACRRVAEPMLPTIIESDQQNAP